MQLRWFIVSFLRPEHLLIEQGERCWPHRDPSEGALRNTHGYYESKVESDDRYSSIRSHIGQWTACPGETSRLRGAIAFTAWIYQKSTRSSWYSKELDMNQAIAEP